MDSEAVGNANDLVMLAREGLDMAASADQAAFAQHALQTYQALAEAYLRLVEETDDLRRLRPAFEALLGSLRPGSIVAAAPNPADAVIRYYANFSATQMEAFEAILKPG